MIEVFKTNVKAHDQADLLIHYIHKRFPGYQANFDLHDCDNILRVKTENEFIQSDSLIKFLEVFGFDAEVLPDGSKPGDAFFLTSVQDYRKAN